MAESAELNIVLKLLDEASVGIKQVSDNFKTHAETLTANMKKVSEEGIRSANEMRQFGRTITQLGLTMTFFGAAILGPFILAIKQASEHNTALAMKVDNLRATFEALQMKMATAVIPIIDRFSNIIFQLNTFLNSLSPITVNAIMQTTMLTGVFLILSGILTLVVGKIITLATGLKKLYYIFIGFAAANAPLVIIAVSIALLVTLMMKFQVVSNTVMSTFQVLFLTLKNGFDGIVIAVESAVLGVLTTIQWIVDALAKIPGPTHAMFQNLSSEIRGVTETLKIAIESHVADIQSNVDTISGIFEKGTGTWSQSFDKFKDKVEDIKNKLGVFGTQTKTTTETSKQLWDKQATGVQGALGTMSAALSMAAAENKKFAIAAKVVAIGLAIVNTAIGVTNALAVPPPWLGMALAAIIAAAGAIQIATIAAVSYAVGTPEVPSDMLATVHKHEMIIPATFADAIRKGQLTLGGSGSRGDILINISVDNPVISKESDIDYLVETISQRLAREVERIR
jgi:hypothetical protein